MHYACIATALWQRFFMHELSKYIALYLNFSFQKQTNLLSNVLQCDE